MPEGHVIHRLAREFERSVLGETVTASSPQGRFAQGAALLDGLVLRDAQAHGKHLFLGFGDPADGTVGDPTDDPVRHWLRESHFFPSRFRVRRALLENAPERRVRPQHPPRAATGDWQIHRRACWALRRCSAWPHARQKACENAARPR